MNASAHLDLRHRGRQSGHRLTEESTEWTVGLVRIRAATDRIGLVLTIVLELHEHTRAHHTY
jgi:hypothetical protein